MDVELKGCPWCGRAAKIRPDGELYVLTVNHSENCILHASESIYTPRNEERRALLVKDWNHRHSGGDADHSPDAGKMGEDAARYRWLRQNATEIVWLADGLYAFSDLRYSEEDQRELDSAIDAARAGERG